jgi:hypothetical protein
MIDAINAAWPYVGPVLVIITWGAVVWTVTRIFNNEEPHED